MIEEDAKMQMAMVCEPARESDLESYTSVQVEEMMMAQHLQQGGQGASEEEEEMMMMRYMEEIDPMTGSQSRSSTELNTSSCSRSSSFDTRYVVSSSSKEGGGCCGGGSKPHKAQDAAWEAIARVKERYGGIGLGNFRFVQRLGSGDIGSVYLAQLKVDEEEEVGEGVWFAVKVMEKRALAERKKVVRAQTEAEILGALDHPFLPTLYAHLDHHRHFSCLVIDFCPGGDLHVLRQRQPHKRFSEDAVRFYAAEVLLALEYLHMMGIVYRDLKPENVLVREDGHIMLSDFDLSLKCTVDPVLYRLASVRKHNAQSQQQFLCMPRGSKSSGRCVAPCSVHPIASCLPVPCFMTMAMASSKKKVENKGSRKSSGGNRSPMPELVAEPTSVRSMSFVGTHEYLAPEIIMGDGHGSAVDWWTLGIFIYELLHGRTPFKGSDNEMTLMNVVTQPLKFPSDDDVAADSSGSSVYCPSAAAQDLMRGLLVKDPAKRMAASRGAPEIKHHPFFAGVNWALIRCAVPPEIPPPFTIPSASTSSSSLAPSPPNSHNSLPHEHQHHHKCHSHSPSQDFHMF